MKNILDLRSLELGHREQNLSKLRREYGTTLFGYLKRLDSSYEVSTSQAETVKFVSVIPPQKKLPSQGWKIHVSASAAEGVSLCNSVMPWLLLQRVHWKIAADVDSIIEINSGDVGETQTGKILTIYPSSDSEAKDIARNLDRLWTSTEGPAIPSDLAVRKDGAVFLRYGAFDGGVTTDKLGRTISIVSSPDGQQLEDIRSSDGSQHSWVHPPIPNLEPAIQNLAGPFEAADESYLPIFLLHKSPRGKVFLGIKISDASEVVIKTARRGVGGVGGGIYGASSQERLRAEYQTLRALHISHPLAPTPLMFCDYGDVSVLVMEHIDGELVSDLSFEQQVTSLHELATAIQEVHDNGFVHRDVKLSNAVKTGAGVRLIDFELAVKAGAEEFTSHGTRGYIPPGSQTFAHESSDVFALGVCVAHVFLGFDPARMPENAGRLIGLMKLRGHGRVAKLVSHLTNPIPCKRPSARTASEMISKIQPAIGVVPNSKIASGTARNWALRAAYEAACATREYRIKMPHGVAWQSSPREAPAEGLNSGSAGVILGLMSIASVCRTEKFHEDIQQGAERLASTGWSANAHGLFTGNAGAALALGVTGKRFRHLDWLTAAQERLTVAVERIGNEFDLFSGASGVLWAGCLTAAITKKESFLQIVEASGEMLLKSVELREGVYVWPNVDPYDPPMTGAAHGAAGIAMALAAWGKMSGRLDALELAVETFERLFENGRIQEGKYLRRTIADGNLQNSLAPVLPWCHGIAGFLWCILNSLGDYAPLRSAIDWAVERCSTARSQGCPVYCHGLAGEMELWRMISAHPRLTPSAQDRVSNLAASLRQMLIRKNGLSTWASEDPHVLKSDLWVGSLGPATELALFSRRSCLSLLSENWLQFCAAEEL